VEARLLKVDGHGFTFEVPNRRLVLPDAIKEQAKTQASVQLEATLAQRMNLFHGKESKYPDWARSSFHLINPISHEVLDSVTNRLYSEAKTEPGFVARWDFLDCAPYPSSRSVQALKLLMKRHYPDFLKQNELSDSVPSVNAFSLLVLKEYQKHMQTLIGNHVTPNVVSLKKYSDFPDPKHQFLEGLSENLHLNISAIGLSKHAGFENPLLSFLEAHKHLVILVGSAEGRDFYRKWGKESEAEMFKSAVKMHEKLTPIGLL